jgi:type IV pilus assembly protein PilF
MLGWVGYRGQLVRWAVAACGAISVVGSLAGCAVNQEADAVRSTASAFTQSDEPETRRRARIRLELASNYFENGQINVALDEVKQAISADSAYADAFNLRGLIYMQMKDFPQAEDSFRRALALRVGDPNVQHNYGWLLCQQQKYAEADPLFDRALTNPTYTARAKTLMAKGLCQMSAGQFDEAEGLLIKSYELDAGNPVVGYNLAALLFRRNEMTRAQFYIRRLNNSQFANAESLWLGVKVERALGDTVAMRQLSEQLRKRFPDSREQGASERGAFNE